MNRRDFLRRTSAAALFGSVLIEQAWAKNTDFVVAGTSFGKVRGVENRGIKIFKGIPYGASTGGVNRFMPPVDPIGWARVRDALEYGTALPRLFQPHSKMFPLRRSRLRSLRHKTPIRLPVHPSSKLWAGTYYW
jgi:hypothetical protein